MATPSPEKKPVRRQAFNFDTFAKDSLAKYYTVPAPVTSVAQALAENGNDEKAIVALINKGRLAQAQDIAWADPTGWFYSDKNAPGTKPFEGAIVQPGGVMQTVRTLAMTIFGMTPEMSKEDKKARRQKALELIKGNSEIRDGLKNQALAEDLEEDLEEDDK